MERPQWPNGPELIEESDVSPTVLQPKPSEKRLSCGFCGFTAPESEYRKKHDRCWAGLAAVMALLMLPASLIAYFVFRILVERGVTMEYNDALVLVMACGLFIWGLVFAGQEVWIWLKKRVKN